MGNRRGKQKREYGRRHEKDSGESFRSRFKEKKSFIGGLSGADSAGGPGGHGSGQAPVRFHCQAHRKPWRFGTGSDPDEGDPWNGRKEPAGEGSPCHHVRRSWGCGRRGDPDRAGGHKDCGRKLCKRSGLCLYHVPGGGN